MNSRLLSTIETSHSVFTIIKYYWTWSFLIHDYKILLSFVFMNSRLLSTIESIHSVFTIIKYYLLNLVILNSRL